MRRKHRIMAASFVVLGLVAPACGDDDDDDAASDTDAAAASTASAADATTAETSAGTEATTADTDAATADTDAAAEPQEFMIMVDGRVDEYNGAFFAYFPDRVSVHPGDRIIYHSIFSGEPHSATFGSSVDEVVTGFMELTPEQQAGEAPPPPELEAAFELIPAMLPDGPGDANQVSVNPCFVAEGEEIPTDAAAQCPVIEPAPFTGTETFYNSGFLPDNETFVVELSEDIAPGTYYAFCTLHFVEMISEITVVPADEPVPTPEEVAAEGQAQLEELAALGVPPLEEAESTATPGHVHAGLGSEESTKVLVDEFVPGDMQTAVGEAVTWTIAGPHTVSFNAPEEARTFLVKGDDGGFHLVESALVPAGFEPPPPPAEEPSEDEPPPPVDAGSWDGTGFFNSGIMFGGDFVLRFSQPGSYEYVCLIHPEMQGTVTVQ